MPDAIKLEQAIRIVLAHPYSLTPAAAELLRAALDERPFNAKTVNADCRVCGRTEALPLDDLVNSLGLCDACVAAVSTKERRG